MSTRACAPSARRFGASRARNLRCSSSSARESSRNVYLQPVPVTHSGKRALITLPQTLRRKCAPLKALAYKKALYVNKESFSTLYSHQEPFYTLTLSKGHIFCVKYAVKLLVPSSRNESPAHFVDSSFRDDSRGREAVSRHVSLRTSRNGSSDPHQLHSD